MTVSRRTSIADAVGSVAENLRHRPTALTGEEPRNSEEAAAANSSKATPTPARRNEALETAPLLRIVHVITRLLNGGADENTVLSCNYAAREGHDVTLIHGADTHREILAKIDPLVRVIAVPSLVRPISPLSDTKALRDLVRVFRDLKPDIVHTHTSKAGIVGRLAAHLVETPVIIHGVHIVPFVNVSRAHEAVYRSAERAMANVTDVFINVSSGTRNLFVQAGVGSADRHHVIHSGFDLPQFRDATPPKNWRELLRLGLDETRPPVLLMIAAFEARKRHLEFLQAFPRVVTRFPNVRLVLAGEGKLREAVERYVVAQGMERNVVLTGFHARPEELIALADVSVLASAREGLPRAVVQSIAGGTPVVVTSLPGVDDVLRHDVNGLIVDSGDIDALVDATIELLADDSQRIRLAHAAAATDLSAWDGRRMVEAIQSIYKEAIASCDLRYASRSPSEAPGLPQPAPGADGARA